MNSSKTLDFSIFSQKAHSVSLLLFEKGKAEPFKNIPLDNDGSGTWLTSLENVDPESEYLFELDKNSVLDPYAKALSSPNSWYHWQDEIRCQLTYDHSYDWENIEHVTIDKNNLMIYEMHVRGFTCDESSSVVHRGTFNGIIEKLDHIKSLGATAIELMPVLEFDEREVFRPNNDSDFIKCNYWGYSTVNFFSPMKRFASNSERLTGIIELKNLVKECHKKGVAVILDVVYNHVSQKSCLEDIDKEAYFILSKDKQHTNYSGCGNTINANSQAGTNLIMSSLKYLVSEFMVDGFRFDLGALLALDGSEKLLKDPPIIKCIESDPLLSDKLLIAEPWDSCMINLQDNFPSKKFYVWSGSYKNAARMFIRGNSNTEEMFFNSMSSHVIGNNTPINFVTCHDGFSLYDLVSYNNKHNIQNGENNADGDFENLSWNCGEEGCSTDPNVTYLRKKQIKNFILANTLSLGTPMIFMGDEFAHTHNGNNNCYCIDGKINWMDWNLSDFKKDILEFYKNCIALRKEVLSQEDNNMKLIHSNDNLIVISINDKHLLIFNAKNRSENISQFIHHDTQILLQSFDENLTDEIKLPEFASLIACVSN